MFDLDPSKIFDGHEGDDVSAYFTIVPGREIDPVTLQYRNGKWELSIYSPAHYNGPDIQIHRRQAGFILENLASEPLEDVDWDAHSWVYHECDECPCEAYEDDD